MLRAFRSGHDRAVHVMMGERAFLLGTPREGTIVATEDSEFLELPRESVVPLTLLAPRLAALLHAILLRVGCRKLMEISEVRARRQSAKDRDDLLREI